MVSGNLCSLLIVHYSLLLVMGDGAEDEGCRVVNGRFFYPLCVGLFE